MLISKENHAARTCTIVIDTESIVQDISIYLLGDVTGDGQVTASDYSRLLAHVKKTNPLW